MNKRYELFHEFLYYVFDSLLIPLIRSNFYVTESNTHRFQVFYFRHDVWRLIAEPSIASLKEGMFEEIKLSDATRILDSRRLGFSQLRLLPKGTKLRPIMNLRRRQMVDGKRTHVLGPSINSLLKPIHTAFKFETVCGPLSPPTFACKMTLKLTNYSLRIPPSWGQHFLPWATYMSVSKPSKTLWRQAAATIHFTLPNWTSRRPLIRFLSCRSSN